MEKLVDWLTLKPLKGSRTAISLLVAGVLGVLSHFGVISADLVEQVIKLGTPFGLYFAVEHWSPKK